MNDLSERIKDLAVKFLIAETRDYRGATDKPKQTKALVTMLRASRIESLFDLPENSFARTETFPNKKEYQESLEKLLDNRNQSTIKMSNYELEEILQTVVKEVIDRTEDEAQSRATGRDVWELKKQIEDLKAELEFGKPARAVTFWNRLNSRANLPYLIVLFLVAILIGGLVLISTTATMTVSVEFSVGEIIGGLLVGTGVAAAGISYATKDKGKPQENKG